MSTIEGAEICTRQCSVPSRTGNPERPLTPVSPTCRLSPPGPATNRAAPPKQKSPGRMPVGDGPTGARQGRMREGRRVAGSGYRIALVSVAAPRRPNLRGMHL
jgi:hypothetical protein